MKNLYKKWGNLQSVGIELCRGDYKIILEDTGKCPYPAFSVGKASVVRVDVETAHSACSRVAD